MGVSTNGNTRRVVLGLGDTSVASGTGWSASSMLVFSDTSEVFDKLAARALAGNKDLDVSDIPGEVVVIEFTQEKSLLNLITLLQGMLGQQEGEE